MSDKRTDRRIVLGMPGYGKQTGGASRAFWNACADMRQVWKGWRSGSLLASNFNQLWCVALNLVHSGHRVDYFAMLHDDVEPDDFWLDVLIDELEAKQLDVLGVVVPIKDTAGMTSMALHRDGDNWMPLARLSMHDVYALPETFTSDDLGHPLLLNTGCWVAKWNQEWCRQIHFEINDRIVFNKACNRYQAQTEPEDWFFSRQLNEFAKDPVFRPLRIGATRKIGLDHTGEMKFSNRMPWGNQAFDRESVKVSPVPGAFPRDIPGWLHEEEGKALAELARGKRVLEIGSYCGLSTICMARTAEHVTAVDYFDGRGTPEPRDTYPIFVANTNRYGVADRVATHHPDEPLSPYPGYDLAFIDGAHHREAVDADIQKVLTVLKPDGLIAFHDYSRLTDFDVCEAVDDFIADGAELISVHNTLAVVRPPAAIPLEV